MTINPFNVSILTLWVCRVAHRTVRNTVVHDDKTLNRGFAGLRLWRTIFSGDGTLIDTFIQVVELEATGADADWLASHFSADEVGSRAVKGPWRAGVAILSGTTVLAKENWLSFESFL